jgi:hypothetical protein
MTTSGMETPSESRARWRFFHHYLEMILVMVGSMVVFGAIVSGIFALLGHANLYHYADFRAVVMAANMVLGMSLWMKYRGHEWASIGEMGAAMFLPTLLLVGPYWAGVIAGGALLGGAHLLMLPFMFLAMLRRREEYSQHHKLHLPRKPRAASNV